MKRWWLWLLVLLAVSGCTYDKYNSMVMRQNQLLLAQFGEALSKQTSEGGRLAVTLLFATGAGRQTLARPETAATYLPMINSAILPWITLFHHHSDDDVNQSYAAGRDSHGGVEMMSQITGDYNTNTQYVCPNCPDGVEGGDGEAGITGDVDSCNSNPPAGYQGSIPLYSPHCSCSSHYSGNC